MKYCLITFRSVTPAQKAEQVLRKNGFESALWRTPKQMEEQGCGYSLRIRAVDAARAATVLRQYQVGYRKVYLLSENGLAEEMMV